MQRIILWILIIFCFSCSTKQTIRIDKIEVNFKPEIDLIVDSNNLIFNFTFVINQISKEEKQKLDLINFLKVELLDDNNKVIDSTSINSLIRAGNQIKGYNLIYFGKVVINNFIRRDFDKITCKVTLAGNNWDLIYTQKLNEVVYQETEPALVLYPIIKKMDENSIDLGVFAVRKRVLDEYIPNSETIRIEVLNSKNKPVYSSQEGKAFMQLIMPVEPQTLGDYFLYEYTWDYSNNDGIRLPSGEYIIKIKIPAHPKPYITELKIPIETI